MSLEPRRALVIATSIVLAIATAGCAGPSGTGSSPGVPTQPPGSSGAPRPIPSAKITAAPLPAAPGFAAGVPIVVTADPVNPAVGDLNRDGFLDVVSASESGAGLSVLLGRGDGTFEPPTVVAAPKTGYVGAADLNGDGTPDLIAAGDGAATVFIGKGDGSFGAPTTYSVKGDLAFADPLWLTTGNLNGDGAPDLMVSVYGDPGPNPAAPGHLAVFINKGDGTFASPVFYTDPAAVAVAAADFNGDGKLDVATADFDATVRIFSGDGSGRLGPSKEFAIDGQGAAIVAGDLNRDAAPDLLVGNDHSNSVSVLLGDGHEAFGAAQSFEAGNTHAVAIADLDGDGKMDLLAGGITDRQVTFWRGAGDGTFIATANVDIGVATSRGLATADFNADGKLDLAVADATTTLYIFLAK